MTRLILIELVLNLDKVMLVTNIGVTNINVVNTFVIVLGRENQVNQYPNFTNRRLCRIQALPPSRTIHWWSGSMVFTLKWGLTIMKTEWFMIIWYPSSSTYHSSFFTLSTFCFAALGMVARTAYFLVFFYYWAIIPRIAFLRTAQVLYMTIVTLLTFVT